MRDHNTKLESLTQFNVRAYREYIESLTAGSILIFVGARLRQNRPSIKEGDKQVGKTLVESRYTFTAVKALECFSIQPENIELIAHSENVTFRVAPRDSDTRYALRVHRPDYNTLDELESERKWTSALKDAGIAAPEAFLTRQGHHLEWDGFLRRT